MTAVEVSAPFQPQHQDAEIVLERIVMLEGTPVYDSLWWKMYNAGGYAPHEAVVIAQKLRDSALSLLKCITGREYKLPIELF